MPCCKGALTGREAAIFLEKRGGEKVVVVVGAALLPDPREKESASCDTERGAEAEGSPAKVGEPAQRVGTGRDGMLSSTEEAEGHQDERAKVPSMSAEERSAGSIAGAGAWSG